MLLNIKNTLAMFCVVVLFIGNAHGAARPCIDPFSTVDWAGFINKISLTGNKPCVCKVDKKVKVGVTVQLYEPVAFVEVAREGFYFPCWGIKAGGTSSKYYGTNSDKDGVKRNVHYIKYPVFGVLNIVLNHLCIDLGTQPDIRPPSELDPRVNNPILAMLWEPEKILFATPVAVALQLYDCIRSSVWQPDNSLHYIAGCWGTMGEISTNTYGSEPVVEAALLAAKAVDLCHADNQCYKYSEGDKLNLLAAFSKSPSPPKTLCEAKVFPRIIKSQYAFSVAYPTPSEIIPLGDFGLKSLTFKQMPGGEDWVFTVWRKRDCCIGFQLP